MNVELKKLTRSIYLVISLVIVTLSVTLWVVTHSFITIQLSPRNATLVIDGKDLNSSGNSIVRKFVSPGTHQVEVEADDYIGISESIDFRRGFPKKIIISLLEKPAPTSIADGGEFLTKGNNFNEIYYLNGGNTLYKAKIKVDENGKAQPSEVMPITGPTVNAVEEIIWSPTKELALFKRSTEVTLFDFKKYDFVNQTEDLWGNDIGSIAWAPDNSKIAYCYAPAGGEQSLIFANLTNTEITRVFNFKDYGIDNPLLRWSPDSEWLLVIPRNQDADKNHIYLFNSYSRSMTEIADTGNQLDAQFSPDGNKIIYSTYSKDPSGQVNSVLSVMNTDGSNKKSLGVYAILSKTAWSKDSANIVVATYDPVTKGEEIYKYNVDKKQKDGFILTDVGDIFINSLILSDDNKMIVYQDNSGINVLAID
jgi:hypothetical protein